MSLSNLRVEIVPQAEGVVLVRLVGEARLDVEMAGTQLNRVIVHHPKLVVVDCSELTFLSSIGMSLLVNLHRTVKKTGGVARIAAVVPEVRKALQHARLTDLFEMHETVEGAFAGMPAGQPQG